MKSTIGMLLLMAIALPNLLYSQIESCLEMVEKRFHLTLHEDSFQTHPGSSYNSDTEPGIIYSYGGISTESDLFIFLFRAIDSSGEAQVLDVMRFRRQYDCYVSFINCNMQAKPRPDLFSVYSGNKEMPDQVYKVNQEKGTMELSDELVTSCCRSK